MAYVSGKSLYGHRCWALSAVQLGAPYQLMAMQYGGGVLTLANPVIIKTSDKQVFNLEACTSIKHGGSEYRVKRFKTVKLTALKLVGGVFVPITMREHHRSAFILQHEIDHMKGLTLIETNV